MDEPEPPEKVSESSSPAKSVNEGTDVGSHVTSASLQATDGVEFSKISSLETLINPTSDGPSNSNPNPLQLQSAVLIDKDEEEEKMDDELPEAETMDGEEVSEQIPESELLGENSDSDNQEQMELDKTESDESPPKRAKTVENQAQATERHRHVIADCYEYKKQERPKSKASRTIQRETISSVERFQVLIGVRSNEPEKPLPISLHDKAHWKMIKYRFTLSTPLTPWAFFQSVGCSGASHIVTPVHPEVVLGGFRHAFYMEVTERTWDSLSGRYLSPEDIQVGEVFIVEDIQRKPNIKPEDLSQEINHQSPMKSVYFLVIKCKRLERNIYDKVPAIYAGSEFRTRLRPSYHLYGKEVLAVPVNSILKKGTRQESGWQQALVFIPACLPGTPLQGMKSGEYALKAMSEIAAVQTSFDISPKILKLSPLDDGRLQKLLKSPNHFEDFAQPTKQALEDLVYCVQFGVDATGALPSLKFDNASYHTNIKDVEWDHRGLTFSFVLTKPSGGVMTTMKWERGTKLAFSVDDERFTSAVVIYSERAGNGILVRARLTFSGPIPSEARLCLEGQKCIVRHRVVKYQEFRRSNFGRQEIPDHPELSPAMILLCALHGGRKLLFPPPNLKIVPLVAQRRNKEPLKLSESQSMIRWLLFWDSLACACIQCGPGSGKTTSMMASIVNFTQLKPSDLIVYSTTTNAASAHGLNVLVEFDPQSITRPVRLISVANRKQLKREYQTDKDFPALWPRILLTEFLKFDIPQGNPSEFQVSLGRHLEAKNILPRSQIKNRTTHRACGLSMKNSKPEYSLWRCFIALYQPTVFIGTVVSVRNSFSQVPELYARRNLISRVVVDESSQLPRFSLIALACTFPNSKFLLIGDSRQLPPHAPQHFQPDLMKIAIGNPLREAVESQCFPVVEIPEVYRCPPKVVSLVNELFYDGRLKAMQEELIDDPILQRMKLPSTSPIIFMNNVGSHQTAGKSSVNEKESDLAVRIVEHLMKLKRKEETIGVLSYYFAQTMLLSAKLPAEVTVTTIDSSQGREFSYVVILTTVAAQYHKMPFMELPNRLNVALSRTKRLCFIIGNKKHTVGSTMWSKLITEIGEEQCLDEEQTSRFLNTPSEMQQPKV